MERIKCECKCGCKRDITFDTDYYIPKNGICWMCCWGIEDGYSDVHGIKMNKYTDEELEVEWEKIKKRIFF